MTPRCDFGFVLFICRITAPTKTSSRWLLLAVGRRTGLSDSFVRSFIKCILGVVARPGDQWGTLGLWWGAPPWSQRELDSGPGPTYCLLACCVTSGGFSASLSLRLPCVKGVGGTLLSQARIAPVSLWSITSSRWPDSIHWPLGWVWFPERSQQALRLVLPGNSP